MAPLESTFFCIYGCDYLTDTYQYLWCDYCVQGYFLCVLYLQRTNIGMVT